MVRTFVHTTFFLNNTILNSKGCLNFKKEPDSAKKNMKNKKMTPFSLSIARKGTWRVHKV